MSFTNSLDRVVNFSRSGFFDERLQPFLIVGLTALVVLECFYLLTVPLVTGFETSLVAAYPLSYWVAFYTTFTLCIVVSLLSVKMGTCYWRHALALLLCNYATYFFLARARGYRLYGRGASDILRHLGDVKGILNTGALPGIWYPGEHILLAELHMAGIPLEALMFPVGFAFTALYIVSVGVFLRTLLDKPVGLVVGFCVAAPLVYTELHLTIIPSTLSFFLFPVILFTVERYRRTNADAYLLLFCAFALLIVVFHPMTTIFLVILLLVTSAFTFLYSRLFDSSTNVLSPRLGLAIPPVLFAWLINFRLTSDTILRVYTSYALESGEQTPAQSTAAETAVLSTVEVIMRAFQVFGSIGLLMGIGGLVGIWVLYRLVRTRELPYVEGYTTIQFSVGFGIFVIVMTGFLIVGEPVRVSRYMLLMATLSAGALLVRQLEWSQTVAPALLVACLITAGILGANAAYEPNEHLTDAEYEGTKFMVEFQNSEQVRAFTMTNKMEAYVLGSGDPQLYPETYTSTTTLPPELGYGQNESAAETFGRSYVSTKTYDREFHRAEYFTAKQQQRMFLYNETHLQMLHNDQSANKIFANSGFESWRVVPDEYYQSSTDEEASVTAAENTTGVQSTGDGGVNTTGATDNTGTDTNATTIGNTAGTSGASVGTDTTISGADATSATSGGNRIDAGATPDGSQSDDGSTITDPHAAGSMLAS